jgi:pyruvate kinase
MKEPVSVKRDATIEVLQALRSQLSRLSLELTVSESRATAELADVAAGYRASAINLLHYLVARQVDLRPLQVELGRHGLSSLGRIEGHVADAVEQVIARIDDSLAHQTGSVHDELRAGAEPITAADGDRLLHRHSQALLGPRPLGRHVYVMVTAPDAAEVNASWMGRLLDAGVNVLRINGAHEEVAEWRHVVEIARRVASERGMTLRVLVDLPGPKLRTVAPHPGLEVERWRPERDAFGRVTKPCHVVLRPASVGAEPHGGPALRVPPTVWHQLAIGDELELRDARGRKRRLSVVDHDQQQAIAVLERTAYVVPDTLVRLQRGKRKIGEFRVGPVEARPFRLSLVEGDRFRLRADGDAAESGVLPEICCSLREPLLALTAGERVLFDDGKLECVVETQELCGVVLRVTRAPGRAFRLGAEKGINLPDSTLGGPSLGPDDERALAFAVESADIVGASFVRNPDDVRALYARLRELGAEKLGVILKIETVAAFTQLPAILLAAMSRYQLGVMIARGDLAVEAGFERLAELQEEILWLCEAAHLPVIWATQVLDQMARTGQATRAEVTDAAMSERAECVMLNKGPYIVEAVTTLVDILGRMGDHQYKKRSLSRQLHLEVPNAIRAAPNGTTDPLRG